MPTLAGGLALLALSCSGVDGCRPGRRQVRRSPSQCRCRRRSSAATRSQRCRCRCSSAEASRAHGVGDDRRARSSRARVRRGHRARQRRWRRASTPWSRSVALPLWMSALWLDSPRRNARRLLFLGIGTTIGIAIATVDLLWRSRPYYDLHRSEILSQVALFGLAVVGGVVAALVLPRWRWMRAHLTRWRRPVAAIASVLTVAPSPRSMVPRVPTSRRRPRCRTAWSGSCSKRRASSSTRRVATTSTRWSGCPGTSARSHSRSASSASRSRCGGSSGDTDAARGWRSRFGAFPRPHGAVPLASARGARPDVGDAPLPPGDDPGRRPRVLRRAGDDVADARHHPPRRGRARRCRGSRARHGSRCGRCGARRPERGCRSRPTCSAASIGPDAAVVVLQDDALDQVLTQTIRSWCGVPAAGATAAFDLRARGPSTRSGPAQDDGSSWSGATPTRSAPSLPRSSSTSGGRTPRARADVDAPSVAPGDAELPLRRRPRDRPGLTRHSSIQLAAARPSEGRWDASCREAPQRMANWQPGGPLLVRASSTRGTRSSERSSKIASWKSPSPFATRFV